jgi:phosphoserine phosphatase RsbU/P
VTAAELEGELEAVTAELVQVQDQLLALYELARAMRGYLEAEPLLAALVGEAIRLVRADAAFAVLPVANQDPLVVVSPGSPLEPAAAVQMIEGGPNAARQLQSPFGRALLIPVVMHDRASAVLGLVRTSGDRFDMPDQKLAAAVAEHAGSQLETVLAHQESLRRTRLELEFELARSVQIGLMPPQPVGYHGIDVLAETRPASIVGGDFFDFIARADGTLLCVLGDVAGHGIPAAMLVAMTRAAVRAAARSDAGRAPSEVLRRANEDLQGDFNRLGLFATAFLTLVDPSAGRMTIANAGHSPVIYRPAAGCPRIVPSDAPPLGVMDDWEGADMELPLGPGDLLVAATDGFSEAEDARTGEFFGYQRLLDLADRAAAAGAAGVAAAFFKATNEFCAGMEEGAGDDRTLLVARGVPRRGEA